MILKSMEVASAAPEGAKVVMSSTCQRREQFRLKGLWICQKGHCCFEEVSSKIYSKLFHDEMKNLIDSHESYHGAVQKNTQSLGLISPSSQGPGVLWRLGPHPQRGQILPVQIGLQQPWPPEWWPSG